MEDIALQSPFGNEPLEEIHLPAAPLDLVLTQIRYPRLSAWLNDDEPARRYASAMSADYPITTQTNELAVTITPDGVNTTPTSARLWTLTSLDEKWKISFGDSFIAVLTTAYSDRTAFFERLHRALSVFVDIANPPRIDRIGVRYINRILDQPTIKRMRDLVRPEVLGAIDVSLPEGAQLNQSYCESQYRFSDAEGLHARWGILPPGAVLDPTLKQSEQNSWVLDLDSYIESRQSVDTEMIIKQARGLAERSHRYFRWAVTPEFLKKFGASS